MPNPPSRKRFSTNYISFDFLYVIQMPIIIHFVYILLLLQFVSGACLFQIILDYHGTFCRMLLHQTNTCVSLINFIGAIRNAIKTPITSQRLRFNGVLSLYRVMLHVFVLFGV